MFTYHTFDFFILKGGQLGNGREISIIKMRGKISVIVDCFFQLHLEALCIITELCHAQCHETSMTLSEWRLKRALYLVQWVSLDVLSILIKYMQWLFSSVAKVYLNVSELVPILPTSFYAYVKLKKHMKSTKKQLSNNIFIFFKILLILWIFQLKLII